MTLLVRPRVNFFFFFKASAITNVQLTTTSRKPSVEDQYDFKLLQFGCFGF